MVERDCSVEREKMVSEWSPPLYISLPAILHAKIWDEIFKPFYSSFKCCFMTIRLFNSVNECLFSLMTLNLLLILLQEMELVMKVFRGRAIDGNELRGSLSNFIVCLPQVCVKLSNQSTIANFLPLTRPLWFQLI